MKKWPTIEDLVVNNKPEFEKRKKVRETGMSFMESVEKKMVQAFYDERMPHAGRYDWTNRLDYVYKLYAVIEELYLSIWSSEEYNNYFSKTVNEFIAADKQALIDTEAVFYRHMCVINKLFNKYIEEKYNVLSVFGITEQPQCRIAGKESYGCLHFALTKRDTIINPGMYNRPHYDLFPKFNEDCLKNDDVKEVDKVNDASAFRKFLENYDAEKFEKYRTVSKEFNSKIAELKEKIQHDILDLINEGYCLTDFGMRLH